MFDLPFELPDGWELKTVEKLIDEDVIEKPLDGNHGGTHPKSSDYVESGIPFVMASDLDNGRVNFDDCKFITEEQASSLRKGFSKAGDVLLSHKATIGRTAIVQKNKHDYIMLTPQVTYYRVIDESKLDNVYLKAYFDSNFFQSILGLWAGAGSTRAYLGITGQLKLPIIVPPIDNQKSIASQVGSINDKIELNRQTNLTLEHIAQAIFKSWFVDFEPTRAKIAAKQAGQDPERAAMAAISGLSITHTVGAPLDELDQLSPEQQEQLKTTAALFPDALVDSELSEIPEGWEVKLNGDVMDVRDGTHDSPKQSETGFPLVTSKHITSGVLELKDAYLISEEDYQNVNKRSRVNQGDILLTMIGTVGIPHLVMQPEVNFAIKNIGLFRTSEIKELKSYFYLLLKSPKMEAYLNARMAGTTQKYLSLKTLRSLEMLEPPAEILSAFNALIDPIMDKIFSSTSENKELSELSDTLLPRFLSGEIELQSTVEA